MNNPENNAIKRAVIYCRVSTKEQVEEGNSLVSQERICREYAQQNQYLVENVFIEQGESAKTTDRTELQKLLGFCSNKKNGISAVITYKIDRISRNMDGYSEIRILLKRYGVEIKSVTEFFENTPAGRFMENIIANVAQFDNDVRAERCAGGMKEAVKEGRYVWRAPLGYTNVKVNGKASIEPSEKAIVIQETFKRVAANTQSSEEIWREMSARGLKNKNGKPFAKSYFYQILRNEIYVGMINKFGLRIQGNFKPIISRELFDHVQKVMKSRGRKTRFYKMKNPDFPLRNFIKYENGEPLVGAWSKGRSKLYAYYWFKNAKISARKEKLEELFVDFWNKYELYTKDINRMKFYVGINVLLKNKELINEQFELTKDLNDLKTLKQNLILKNLKNVISDADYHEQLPKLEKSIFKIESKLIAPNERNDEAFKKGLQELEIHMKNPGNTWLKSPYQARIGLQWFNFPEGVVFDGKICRTDEICSIYKAKTLFQTPLSTIVDYSVLELNQHSDLKLIHKWLNSLPNPLYRDEVFWKQVYDDVIKLAEILKTIRQKRNIVDN